MAKSVLKMVQCEFCHALVTKRSTLEISKGHRACRIHPETCAALEPKGQTPEATETVPQEEESVPHSKDEIVGHALFVRGLRISDQVKGV